MSFLPTDYKAPSLNTGYMKIQEGENKFRILSKPILGWEDWDNKRPVRFRFENKPEKSIDPKMPVRHFWAFLCWNYAEEKIQILHLTQASIRNKIQSLSIDKDWGEPYFFDIKVVKKGQGKDTEYEVHPVPHKDLHPSIEEAFHAKPCYLEALFDNGDPFSPNWKTYTEGVFKSKYYTPENTGPTNNQLDELHSILSQCSEEYQATIEASLKKLGKTIATMDNALYLRVMNAAKKNRDEYLALNNKAVPF